MADILTDGIFTVASPHGPARFSAPIGSLAAHYLLEQDMTQNFASYSPLALDSANPDFGSYILIGETALQDFGCGVAKWTRVYAQVPADHDEYESFGYSFIGYGGNWFSGFNGQIIPAVSTGRPRFVQVVTSRVAHHYVKTTNPRTDNPPILQQRYTQGPLVNGVNTDFIYDATGIFVSYPDCVPTRTQYEAVVAGGAGIGTGAGVGEIVAEDSRLIRWLDRGNIWLRQTRYVKAL